MGAVTVIIPTLNRKALLLEALESAFAQTYRDYDILVIDDGSTDGTHDALSSYGDRLRYVRKNNGGEASARNRGILEAGTAYIAFLDSDDLWDPTFLETTITHLEKNPTLGLVSTGCVFFPDEKRRPRIRKRLLQGDLFPLLFYRNFITASAVVVKSDCFRQVGLFNESLELGVDYDMWLRIAKAYPIAFLNRSLCRWRRHDGNISATELRHRQCVLQVVSAHFDSARIPETTYRHRRSRLLASMGRAHVTLGNIEQAKSCFSEAVALTPWAPRIWQDLCKIVLLEKCRSLWDWRAGHR